MIMIMNDDDELTTSKFNWIVRRESAQVVKLLTTFERMDDKEIVDCMGRREEKKTTNVSLKWSMLSSPLIS